jgi:amino acid permease
LLVSVSARLGGAGPFPEGWGCERGVARPAGVVPEEAGRAFVSETGSDAEGGELERSIGLFELTMFGVGATIGTGIFIVLTEAVPEAGPAVILSFVLAGITAALTAVC